MVSLISATRRAMALLDSSRSAPVGSGSGLACSVIGGAATGECVHLRQQILLAFFQFADAALVGLDAVAHLGLAHVRHGRLGAALVDIAAAVQVGLRHRVRLQRRLVVLGVDEDDFQSRIGRLPAPGSARRSASPAKRHAPSRRWRGRCRAGDFL
jgi:hypothetical protein